MHDIQCNIRYIYMKLSEFKLTIYLLSNSCQHVIYQQFFFGMYLLVNKKDVVKEEEKH